MVGLGATAGGIGGMFMTLLAGLAVQWTGNQQIVFVWAGMHASPEPGAVLDLVPGRIVQVDVDTPLDVSRSHGALAIAGVIVALAGAALATLVFNYWEYLRERCSITGAVQSGVVAAAVFLIGVALFYASRPKAARA